jgi:hypothetical protein
MSKQFIDRSRLKTYPLASRTHKVTRHHLAHPCPAGSSLSEFLSSLPDVLVARDLRELAQAICRARRGGRPVLAALGAHVIKCGLSPIIIDLCRRGVLTGLALNGAGIIHDFELAWVGGTSEDVASALLDGSFGMAEETGSRLNRAICRGASAGWGLGEAVGRMLHAEDAPHRDISLLATALELGIPVTVHVALGTDIIHMHPDADGAAIGQTSYRDFLSLAEQVADLEGGVFLNIGSAVILPEVFLKTVSMVRNLGRPLRRLTTANLDFLHQYRPRANVVQRPTVPAGRGYDLRGHH